jgi:hypothetical protein
MPIPFPTTIPRRVYSLTENRGAGRRQVGSRCCCCSRSRFRSSCSEKGTPERSGHRAHSGGSRDQTAPRMERHRRPQPRVQKLLAQWKSRAVKNGILSESGIAQIILPRGTVNDVLAKRHGGPSGGLLGINNTWVRSGKDATGCRQETMLRSGGGSATPVQPVVASEPRIEAKCINTTLGPHSKIYASIQQVPSHRATKEIDIS